MVYFNNDFLLRHCRSPRCRSSGRLLFKTLQSCQKLIRFLFRDHINTQKKLTKWDEALAVGLQRLHRCYRSGTVRKSKTLENGRLKPTLYDSSRSRQIGGQIRLGIICDYDGQWAKRFPSGILVGCKNKTLIRRCSNEIVVETNDETPLKT